MKLEKTRPGSSNRIILIAVLMTLLALFAPVTMTGFIAEPYYDIYIAAVLWILRVSDSGISLQFLSTNYFLEFALAMLPFILLRLGFVVQITRYYQEKTTRGRAIVAAVISEAPFLAVSILTNFLNYSIPVMMVVGLLILWRFPLPATTVPWEGMDEPTPWWDEEKEENSVEQSED